MFQIITILFSIVAIIVAFFDPIWSWSILGIPAIWLFFMFYAVRPRELEEISELSPKANEMLEKFGHYYSRPFGARDISASASTILFTSVIVAIIGLFMSFGQGIIIGIVFYAGMSFLSRQFNPANFLVDKKERAAHEEIIAYIKDS